MRMPESSSPASTSPTAAGPSPPSAEAAGQEPVSSAQSPAPSAEATGNGTGPKRSRRGRPGYDRETLINKATEVFVARGYDGTSMDTVVAAGDERSEEHTSELQSRGHLVCRLLLEKKQVR